MYCLYVDELISILKLSGIGCYLRSIFAAALLYADDMAVLAPSLRGLQKLLLLCQGYCSEWDIRLNDKKTKNMCFGKGLTPSHKLKLSDDCIDWVSEWTYLGVKLVSGPRFGCCVKEKISKFYGAANAILRVEGRSDDVVMLRLLEAHCVPILTYAIEVINVADAREGRRMRGAYNSIFRKVFDYTRRQSVTNLQHALR